MSIKNGDCQVVVGTHALLQSSVEFQNLGLLVIDEEQRFGVRHKEMLRSADALIDTLTLSATPIPRTLQMSMIGLKDLSVMTTPPKGRKEVKVCLHLIITLQHPTPYHYIYFFIHIYIHTHILYYIICNIICNVLSIYLSI